MRRLNTKVMILGAGGGGFGACHELTRRGIPVVIADRNPGFGGNAVYSGVSCWEPGVSLEGVHRILAARLMRAGSGQVQRVHKGINQSNLFLLALGCVLCTGMYFTRDYLPYIFTTESEVVLTAARGIGIMCFVCTFNGFDRVLLNAMRAAGRSVVPMITAQFGCFSRILFGWLIAVRVNNSDGIFHSLLLAAFARMAAIAVYYYIGSGKQAIDRAARNMAQK